MTRQKSFKQLVRTRMKKTGESYTAARANLLLAEGPEDAKDRVLVASDETIRRKSGRGWEEWFDLLDEWGATERTHQEIARWIAEQFNASPSVWAAQGVAVSYERARGLRVVGQRTDGAFAVSASKTVAVPVDRLYDAFVDGSAREQWLSEGNLSERTATRPKSARFDWADGETRVNVTFDAKSEKKSVIVLEHVKLADKQEAERMKAWWRERLSVLKERLEGGEVNG